MIMLMTAELRTAFAEAERRDRFWADNYADFLELYPEMMVAARDGKVVAAEPTLRGLIQRLSELGLGPQDVWTYWVSESMRRLVL